MTSFSTEKKEIRKFGAVAFIFFGLLFSLAVWREKVLMACFFGALFLLGFGFLILPGPLKPAYERWIKITHFIGKTITAIMLVFAYYLVITPAAFLKKVFGGAPISLKPDKNAKSYWVRRSEPLQTKERFFKRF